MREDVEALLVARRRTTIAASLRRRHAGGELLPHQALQLRAARGQRRRARLPLRRSSGRLRPDSLMRVFTQPGQSTETPTFALVSFSSWNSDSDSATTPYLLTLYGPHERPGDQARHRRRVHDVPFVAVREHAGQKRRARRG